MDASSIVSSFIIAMWHRAYGKTTHNINVKWLFSFCRLELQLKRLSAHRRMTNERFQMYSSSFASASSCEIFRESFREHNKSDVGNKYKEFYFDAVNVRTKHGARSIWKSCEGRDVGARKTKIQRPTCIRFIAPATVYTVHDRISVCQQCYRDSLPFQQVEFGIFFAHFGLIRLSDA